MLGLRANARPSRPRPPHGADAGHWYAFYLPLYTLARTAMPDRFFSGVAGDTTTMGSADLALLVVSKEPADLR